MTEARESSDLGGDYFAVRGAKGEYARLFNNRDVYDNEPVIDRCDEWSVVIYIDGSSENTPVVQGLLKDSEHFVLVSSK